jgi:predicted alpha/beta hydrolase family esterase
MPARAFIIHGYLGYPGEAWQPWLKAELEKRGIAASLPAMPHPDRPGVGEWIEFISDLVGEPDPRTVLIAHSLGCQAVLRYLETLGEAGKAVGRTVLVAGRFPNGMSVEEADERTGGDAVLRPWLTIAVDPLKVKAAMGSLTVILSDNDRYIPLDDAKASFPPVLGARFVIEHGKGHFNEDDGMTELPSVLEAAVL